MLNKGGVVFVFLYTRCHERLRGVWVVLLNGVMCVQGLLGVEISRVSFVLHAGGLWYYSIFLGTPLHGGLIAACV
jgi:hypothetical protein